MSEEAASLRRTLRSTGIIGGATVAGLVFGLVRAKVFALMLGPSGLGLFGILTTLVSAGVAIAGLNLQTSGVRAIAAEPDGSPDRAKAHAALWTLTWMCATFGTVLFVLFVGLGYAPATSLAVTPLGLAALGITVFVSIVSSTQLAELQAGGHIGNVARVRLWGSFLSVVASIIMVWLFHDAGLYYAVLAAGVAGIAVSTWYVRRTSRPKCYSLTISDIAPRWRNLLQVGAGVTVGMLATTVGMLALRSIITRLDGLEAAGLFQAAVTVSSANLAIVLAALAADYLPRLSGASHDREATGKIFNDQLRVALTLSAPVLVGICSLAPLVIDLLFSRDFSGAAGLLQWMLIGDVLKIISWCLGYIVLARGATLIFVSGEIVFQICSLAGTWLLYPLIGLPAIGVSYLIGYFFVLVVYSRFSIRRGAVIDTSLLLLAGVTCLAQLAIIFIGMYHSIVAGALGVTISATMMVGSLKMLHRAGVINRIRDKLSI